MSGSIHRLPSGNLRLRVYVGRDPKTGRETRRSKTIPACSDREARKALARFVVECEPLVGLDHGSDAETLHKLIEAWLELKEPNVAPGTFVDYERVAAAVGAHPIGKRKLRELRASHLDAYYAELTAGGMGPGRIRRYHSVVRGALRQAVKWEWIDRSPADNATPPAIGRTEATAPDPEQLAAIIAAADDDLATWLIVASSTGMRPGELAALKWTDIDLDNGHLVVARAIGPAASGTIGPGGLTGVVEKDTKTHRSRPLSLGAATIEVLQRHRRVALERALAVGIHLDPDSYVFSHEPAGGRPWRPDAAGARFRTITKRLGITGIKPYGTRHFAATQLLAAGVDVRTVAHRLGHARTSTTTDVYAHVVQAADQAAADTLDNVIHQQR